MTGNALVETNGAERPGAAAVPQFGVMAALSRTTIRFVTTYLVIYHLPFPLNAFPASIGETVIAAYAGFWHAVGSFAAWWVFSIRLTGFENGSGDTTYNLVQIFCFVVLAALLTCVFTFALRKRAAPESLRRWVFAYLSFSLAYEMALYGAVKVFPGQFPPLTLDRLVQPIGNASPMGLLWTFMGASRGFTVLTGTVEMVGGILLTVRRTRLLGALVCVVAMTLVFALNLCYDVPVKLFSGHLLLTAGFIALPHLRRMLDFFIFNRPAAAAPEPPPISCPRIRRAACALHILFAVWITGLPLLEAYAELTQDQTLSARSPLYGIWRVDDLMAGPPGEKPPAVGVWGWKQVIFDLNSFFAVQHEDDGREIFFCELDPETRTVVFFRRDGPKNQSELKYEADGDDGLTLTGTVEGVPARIRLRRVPTPKFRLTSRGFHLVNEYPYNR